MTAVLDTTKVVAFDIHETLAFWPRGGPRKAAFAIQQLLADHGLQISYQSITAARALVIMLDSAREPFSTPGAFVRAIFARLDVDLPVDLLDRIVEVYHEHMTMELFEDSVEAVQAVHDLGLRTCTFTTLLPWAVEDVLAPLREWLDEYFACYRAGAPKGHPAFYRGITDQLGVQPAAVLAVGDDAEGDVIIPSQVGWRCVHLQRRRPSKPPSQAIAAVANLRQFMDLLKGRRA